MLHRSDGFTGSLLFGTDGDMRPLSDNGQTDEEDGDDVTLLQDALQLSEEDDELVWMQVQGETLVRRAVVYIVGLHRTQARIEIDPSVEIIDGLEEQWPFDPRRPDEIHGLHLVTSPPTLGEDPGIPQPEMYILEYTDDYFHQVHPDDCLILFTMAFQGPDEWTHRVQKVMWGPARASRTHMLLFLRLFWFCQRPSVICWLYINGLSRMNELPPQDLHNGDHVKVNVRSDRDRWTDVHYSETIHRQRSE